MKCRCGCGADTETFSETYGNPFREAQMKKTKLTPGAIQALLRRTSQIMVYSGGGVAYSVAFLGLTTNWWIALTPFIMGAGWLVVDFMFLISQEQSFFFDKTPGLIKMQENIDELLEHKRNEDRRR